MYRFNMFSMFSILFPIIFLTIFGIIIYTIIKGIGQWSSNNKQPVISVVANVVAKRNHTSGGRNSGSSTSYYVTFEVESGDRMELKVPATEFGMIAEGDIGKLTFQGTRYLSFERVER